VKPRPVNQPLGASARASIDWKPMEYSTDRGPFHLPARRRLIARMPCPASRKGGGRWEVQPPPQKGGRLPTRPPTPKIRTYACKTVWATCVNAEDADNAGDIKVSQIWELPCAHSDPTKYTLTNLFVVLAISITLRFNE
jgi:hypothetical protein